ncbi:Uncharacterised protein [Salmonella enterica subsp. enterica serovar Bovismorbificans]|uniref:Uncharacterized protein n=1 Tax=Salmonella enterica subsp. enterica serovar Bovismorbificans TaxID=58097 RepID=A0A655CRN2_SALET|nr:Uncharacterised protein [Salmonella enterica subsp. enterica serovar Bovismorbificans]
MGSSQNIAAAIATIVTMLVAALARPFCRNRASESTSTVMRVRRESMCFSCQGRLRRSRWLKLRKRTVCCTDSAARAAKIVCSA